MGYKVNNRIQWLRGYRDSNQQNGSEDLNKMDYHKIQALNDQG